MDRNWFGLKGIRPVMLLLTVLSLLQGAAIVAQAMLLSKAITLLFDGHAVKEAILPLVYFLVILTLRYTIEWLQRKAAGRFAENTGQSLRQQLLDRIFELGPRFAAREGSGKLVHLAMEGVDRFRSYLELSIPRMIDMMMITIAILLTVFSLDFISGLILLVAMPVLIGFFILLGFAARKMADREWKTYRVLSHHFTDSLRGLETLKYLGRSRAHGETVGRVAEQYRHATMRTLRVAFLSSFALDFFSMLSIAFVAVGLGLRLIGGSIGLEVALIVLLLAPEYFLPVRMLGSDYHASLDGKEAWRTIRTIMDQPPVHREDGQANSKSNADLNSNFSTDHVPKPENDGSHTFAHAMTLPIVMSDIQVVGDGGNVLLKDVNASLGEHVHKVGIVGASGAGKTTLLSVLGGFTELAAGQILAGEHRIAGSSLTEWQRQIAYIPQHPYIFSLSLADNIRFYEPDASNHQVDQAIDAAGLREFVDQLPMGSMQRIGEGGRTLSGGQAQRIALARALLSNRPIILLDEPTTHLDIETEWELKQAILSIFKDKRIFLATHRYHWMKEMDLVWVLQDGQLVETGSHEQLIAKGGVYHQLLTARERGRGQ